MKKTLLPILIGSILLTACRKQDFDTPPAPPAEPCLEQTAKPAGRIYTSDSLVSFTCTSKHCGLVPLSTKNYWVYEDSLFNYGVFVKVQLDTLRYSATWKSLSDDLVWWESSLYVGIPQRLFANDSTIYRTEERSFMPGVIDAKKDYSLFPGDSLRYLGSFDDVAAPGRSLRLAAPVTSPAGSFTDCIYFEKNARNYRKDQVFFKPGIGVIKYIQEKGNMGMPGVKLQQVSTLVAYHIE
ncbi:MAG: hypothetical protein ABL876_16550 [Chitinophagaceae bacterium]